MSNGYSNDLRERVIAYYDEEHTQYATCAVFQISRATLNNWLRQRREMGHIALQPRPQERQRKLNRANLQSYLEQHPDAYLEEIGTVFGVSGSAIFYACQRWGLVRKKANHLPRKRSLPTSRLHRHLSPTRTS